MSQTNSKSQRANSLGDLARPMRLLGLLLLAAILTACVRNEDALPDGSALAGSTSPPATLPPPGGTTPPPGGDPMPPPVDPPPTNDPPPPTDMAIFAATLHPLLTDPNNFCAGCHGANQIPTFAVADVMAAYNVVVSQQRVNLNAPAQSRIYLRPAVDRHNCGGDASCDRIANDFLAAIQDWANQAAAALPPPDPTQQQVVSATTTAADAMDGGTARVDANVIAMFKFDEGAGNVAMDSSGAGSPIALQIEGMEWVDGGGLRNVSGKAQANAADSRKLYDMIEPTREYSVEAWVIADNNAQDGPARIVSYSQDTQVRNFTLGQNAIYYVLRNRSIETSANGTPAIEALDPQVDTNLQHIVATFDEATGRKVYINGQLSIEENLADTLDWLDNQTFVLGNEVTNNRLWQGILRMVAIHNQALSGAEVQQNFDAGAGNISTLRFDLAAALGAPGYIDMQFAELDGESYLFAQPVLVSDATPIRVKNIRVAVNDVAPVYEQVFRRLDVTALQTGLELSSQGAVIPMELGPMADQFQLEFEILGNQSGLAETVAPPAPPPLPADVPEPDAGVRSFSQVNDTMSLLTGIDPNSNVVRDRYNDLRDSLPPTSDMLAFGSAQQIAIQRLAKTYCGAVATNSNNCDNFFGACQVDGNAKDQVADTLYDRIVGDNIATQPDRADFSAEIVSMIDDLGCANGCNGAAAETVLQATCTAALSSAAVTIN